MSSETSDRTLQERLGEHVLRLRRRHGMTQRDLARVVGVDRKSIANWESHRHRPTGRHRARLARALAVSDEYLLHGDAGVALKLRHAALDALKGIAEST